MVKSSHSLRKSNLFGAQANLTENSEANLEERSGGLTLHTESEENHGEVVQHAESDDALQTEQ